MTTTVECVEQFGAVEHACEARIRGRCINPGTKDGNGVELRNIANDQEGMFGSVANEAEVEVEKLMGLREMCRPGVEDGI